MNKGRVPFNAPIPTRNDALECIEPGECPFNLPSPFVPPQAPTILGGHFFAVALVWCNQFNAFGGECCIERITVVGAIPNKALGSSQRDSFIDGSVDKGDFMWASRSRVHGEWKTMSVSNNHELRTLAPLGLSHLKPPFSPPRKCRR